MKENIIRIIDLKIQIKEIENDIASPEHCNDESYVKARMREIGELLEEIETIEF